MNTFKMNKLKSAILLSCAFLFSSCATSNQSPSIKEKIQDKSQVTKTCTQAFPKKRPSQVALFLPTERPAKPYRIIGVASVSKFNFLGMERNSSSMQNSMKSLAASIGGDAIISTGQDNKHWNAKIIAFEKILI